MQPNEITLVVDVENNSSPTSVDYTRYQEQENRVTYISENHTLESRDQLQFYRTFPTKTGNFKGVMKSAVKFTRDYSVAGVDGNDITAPIIAEVSFSIPVGCSNAHAVAIRQAVIALLDTDSVMNDLNIKLVV